jgi:hypothetical protein
MAITNKDALADRGSRISLAGASGTIGQRLTPRLAQAGHDHPSAGPRRDHIEPTAGAGSTSPPAPAHPTPSAREGRAGPWPALWALVLGFFMILVDSTIVSVATPAIMADHGTDVDSVVWVTSAYLLAYAVPLLITGRLGDRFGPRRVYLAGLAVFTLASLWCGLTSSIGELVVARVVQGLGASLMTPQASAVVTRTLPAESRGKAMSLWGATAGLATLVGPILGGVPARCGAQRRRHVPAGLRDPGGAGLRLGDDHRPDLGVVADHRWGGGHGGLRVLAGANVAITPVAFAVTAMQFPIIFYAQGVLGLSPTGSALLLVPMAVVSGALAPIVGRWTDRVHPRWIAGFGMVSPSPQRCWAWPTSSCGARSPRRRCGTSLLRAPAAVPGSTAPPVNSGRCWAARASLR